MVTDLLNIQIDSEFRTLIPPLQVDELNLLEAKLRDEGNRDSIVIWKETGILLDGHHRYEICQEHNIPLREPIELSFADKAEAMAWIIRNQFGRRNINSYQRSVLALKLEDIYRARAKERQELTSSNAPRNQKGQLQPVPQNSAEPEYDTESNETRAQLASLAHISHDTISKVKAIEAKATPEQKEKLRAGTATINQVYVQVRRDEVKKSIKKAEWPTGQYRVIYADPPWQYGNTQPDYHEVQDDHYPTMTVPAICQLPVVDLALEDAVLFLWATSPILEDAFKVINAWGFKYKASFVWDKVKHNMGHYNSVRHEFLLLAVRGSCPPDEAKLFDSVQSIERTEHSEKPEAFREIIDTLYSYGPRIELFARKRIQGWETYGNQLP